MKTLKHVITKGGKQAAIIQLNNNNIYSVVKNDEGYNFYPNISNGSEMTPAVEVISEFENALSAHFAEIEEQKKQEAKEAAEAEDKRINDIISTVKGITPQDVKEFGNMKSVETAIHWSDLHKGTSGKAIIINNEEEYELMQIAIRENGWENDCELQEIRHRGGDHHWQPCGWVLDPQDYARNCERYFSEKYDYWNKDDMEQHEIENIADLIKDDKISTLDELQAILTDIDNKENGYYCGESLVTGDIDTTKGFFGYSYDVYEYSLAYIFKRDFYYKGAEE